MAAATWPMVSDFDMTDSRLGLRVNSKSNIAGVAEQKNNGLG